MSDDIKRGLASPRAVMTERADPNDGAAEYATIMATQKPDPRGPGYMKLYLLAGVCFFCSTMNGRSLLSQSDVCLSLATSSR